MANVDVVVDSFLLTSKFHHSWFELTTIWSSNLQKVTRVCVQLRRKKETERERDGIRKKEITDEIGR